MSDRRLARKNGARAPSPGSVAGARRVPRNDRRPIDIGVLHDHLGYLIRRLQVWVFQDFIRVLAPIDIRPAQYSVLVVIAANPGLSQSDLAERLGIEPARLVRMLDRLERRGLTRRLPSRNDRRSHALRLTPQGQRTLRRAATLAARHEKQLIDRLGPAQHKSMMDILRDFDR